MITLASIGGRIAEARKNHHISQAVLAKDAGVGHSTLDALENGRLGELGTSKIIRILSALGLELQIHETVDRRPTLDQILNEQEDD